MTTAVNVNPNIGTNRNNYVNQLKNSMVSSAILGAGVQSVFCLTSIAKNGGLKGDAFVKTCAKSVGKTALYSAILSLGINCAIMTVNLIKNKFKQNNS